MTKRKKPLSPRRKKIRRRIKKIIKVIDTRIVQPVDKYITTPLTEKIIKPVLQPAIEQLRIFAYKIKQGIKKIPKILEHIKDITIELLHELYNFTKKYYPVLIWLAINLIITISIAKIITGANPNNFVTTTFFIISIYSQYQYQ